MNSRAEYERRMHRVLAHIDEHLEEPLDLPRLAEVACFSPFHFHRLFSAWMGETFGDYLRRRRLEVAARRLTGLPVVAVTDRPRSWVQSMLRNHRIVATVSKPVSPESLKEAVFRIRDFHGNRTG